MISTADATMPTSSAVQRGLVLMRQPPPPLPPHFQPFSSSGLSPSPSRWCFAPNAEGRVVMTDPGRWSSPGRSPGLFGSDFDLPFSSPQEHPWPGGSTCGSTNESLNSR
ncbi:hypothetical protein BO70DRAFT_214824 [Aspergillus heteromorphus CBS 117.55]|uniref:Uncharacterized protein n=1 Tax=Aspergillus heteromorphus CBS 117.55 TaxID=1448321 RepID=A0A317WKQ5_9EURO|nr:uncharacterized protein BO70DRAFT_214824 [Aspergillus heteromorphus CBS 117.55]PWY86963.1 hypothetical protein BO70DRAFT_214824 [Aspergillus heteromorphus CBS 117.55]